MTSIIKRLAVADVDAAWALISDFGGADRAFPGVLSGCQLADGVRTVTFASGVVVQERLVGVDPAERRLAYHVVGGRFTHHNSAWTVTREPDGGGIATWISDILPDETATIVEPLMDAGMAALDRALQRD